MDFSLKKLFTFLCNGRTCVCLGRLLEPSVEALIGFAPRVLMYFSGLDGKWGGAWLLQNWRRGLTSQD